MKLPLRWTCIFCTCCVYLLSACSTDNHGGNLSLTLNGPAPVRAASFRIVGSVSGVSVPSGLPFRVFSSAGGTDTTNVIVVANQGSTLSPPVVSVAVPDTRQHPTLKLIQVTAADYSRPAPTA